MRNKVSVVGAGHVGATLAQYIAENELADVVLVDILEGLPQGKSLDLIAAAPVRPYDAAITGTNSFDDTSGSDVIVITAGLARKPGMSREDLLLKNAEIIRDVTEKACKASPGAVLILVTNPLDVMTYLAWKVSGFPENRVIGMAGVLDSARFRAFIARDLGISVEDVQAFVLGGHGDSMVPLARYCTVSGIPLPQLMDDESIERIIDRTKNAGAEVVAHLKTGSAYYSPGASAAVMVEAVLKDKKRLLPCSAYVDGEFGLDGLYIGVPVVLGEKGVEKIIEIQLTDSEKEDLARSAAIVKENLRKLGF